MNYEYKKSDPVIVYDNKRGIYEREYHDNIDREIELENEIEMLKTISDGQADEYKKISKKVPNKKNILRPFIIGAGISIGVLILMFLTDNFLFTAPTINWPNVFIINSFPIGMGILLTLDNLFKKRNLKKRLNELVMQIEYLLEELDEKSDELEKVRTNKEKTTEPTFEKVPLLNTLDKKRQLLFKKLDILIEYRTRSQEFQQRYLDGTLEHFIKEEEELLMVRKLIEKDLKKVA